jgi:hypothetical protein
MLEHVSKPFIWLSPAHTFPTVEIARIGDLVESDVAKRIIAAWTFSCFGSETAAALILSPSCFYEFEPNPNSCPAFVRITVKSLQQLTCSTPDIIFVGSCHTELSYLPNMYKSFLESMIPIWVGPQLTSLTSIDFKLLSRCGFVITCLDLLNILLLFIPQK